MQFDMTYNARQVYNYRRNSKQRYRKLLMSIANVLGKN